MSRPHHFGALRGVVLTLAAAAALLVPQLAEARGVYRWTDGNGVEHFEDRRAAAGSSRVTAQSLNERDIPAPQILSNNRPNASFRQHVAQLCATAKERRAAYLQASTVYEQTATGIEYALTEPRRAERHAELTADVQRYCRSGAAQRLWTEARQPVQRAQNVPDNARPIPIRKAYGAVGD